jgi:DNA-binding transcriptional regulator YiaG
MPMPIRKKPRTKRAGNTKPVRFHRPSANEVHLAAEEAVRVADSQTDEDVDRAIGGNRDTFAADPRQLIAIRPGDVDVARIRSGLGLTQAAFGAATGIPHRLISDWEQGRKKPSAAARALLLLLDEFGKKALKRLARRAA